MEIRVRVISVKDRTTQKYEQYEQYNVRERIFFLKNMPKKSMFTLLEIFCRLYLLCRTCFLDLPPTRLVGTSRWEDGWCTAKPSVLFLSGVGKSGRGDFFV